MTKDEQFLKDWDKAYMKNKGSDIKSFVLFQRNDLRIVVRNHGDDSYDISVECRKVDALGNDSWGDCNDIEILKELIGRVAFLVETGKIDQKLLK